MKSKSIILVVLLMAYTSTVYANDGWPALYVLDSHIRFWYIVILSLLLEAGILSWRLKIKPTKALLISFVVNLFSATVGIYLLAIGMQGWDAIAPAFAIGYLGSFNQVSTIFIMLFSSAFLETMMARLIWKYEMKKSFSVFVLGNCLSYGATVADLYLFGGWNRL